MSNKERVKDFLLKNLKLLGEKEETLREDAEWLIQCVKDNKIDVFEANGVELTPEIIKDEKAFFVYVMFLICKAEMLKEDIA